MQNETEASTSTESQTVSMQQKFQQHVMSKFSDVQFVFELESGVVKVPAIKSILAASSPVFNAMFNGDLKEKGDVKIVDASPDGFKEFLQFFCEDQVKLTMDNVADVLNLTNKYDVVMCFPSCIAFMKENLTVDELVWGLHLALKFQLDELKQFCLGEIQKNMDKILLVFKIEGNGQVSLLSNPPNRFIPEKDVTNLFVHVSAISKMMLSNLFARLQRVKVFLSSSTAVDKEHNLQPKETICFKLDKSMLLTDIYFSKVYCMPSRSNIPVERSTYKPKQYDYFAFEIPYTSFKLFIKEKPYDSFSKALLLENDIKIDSGENHIKLKPITIKANVTYSIILKSNDVSGCMTNSATMTDGFVTSSLNTRISFPKIDEKAYTHSLVYCLQFQEIFGN